MTPAIRAQLAAHREAMIQLLQNEAGGSAGEPNPQAGMRPGALPRPANPPLSFAQARMWFFQQIEPDNPLYGGGRLMQMDGPLDFQALAMGFHQVAGRHEATRTTFAEQDGAPHQVIAPTAQLQPLLIDLSAVQPDLQLETARAIFSAGVRIPFDLADGPMLRVYFFRLSRNAHLVAIMLHHIISDAWSMQVLLRETVACYEARLNNTDPTLPPLPFQYADFAIWQRARLTGAHLAKLLAFWKQALADSPELSTFPADHTRPALQSFNGRRLPFKLTDTTSGKLKAFARSNGVTPFMVGLAVFRTLLFRYTGQTDALIGTPVSSRDRRELEGLIGCFVNTLVLRNEIDPANGAKTLLASEKTRAAQAYAHQELPYETLVAELSPKRDQAYAPLVQTVFAIVPYEVASLSFSGIHLAPIPTEVETATFDLWLELLDEGGHYSGFIEYNTDLFEAGTIERLATHFQRLVEGFADQPESALAALPLLNQAEQDDLLTRWNQTDHPLPAETTIHGLIESRLNHAPDHTAVISGAHHLTLAALNERADHLAAQLQQTGAEQLVGVYSDRSAEMVVGLLGILKSGSAYVPLDPAFPKSRLSAMIEDAALTRIVTRDHLKAELSEFKGELISLDAPQPNAKPTVQTEPANLAYVIYTSGSTGKPKGVQISQAAVVNFLHTMAAAPGLTARDRLLAVTTISFDIAGLELYLPLTTDATCILASQNETIDGTALNSLLTNHAITAMQATPATWRLILEAGGPKNRNLKVMCGGEALPGELAAQLLKKTDQVWNLYGPTETTIWSAAGRVTGETTRGTTPIGTPIANTQLYVMDKLLNPTPIGVIGQLHIAGFGLARGYRARADLTAATFLPNPFFTGERMYATGDLVRLKPDGSLAFMGRADHQVKLRGFRIELGDIESALTGHDAVSQAAVLIQNNNLTAFYTLKRETGPTPDTGDLKVHLEKNLPAYMVPSRFQLLEAMPLTPNGKVNRKALQQMTPAESEAGEEMVAPATATEEVLAGIWAQILERDAISVRADFFEAGGHSLLGTRLMARVNAQLGVSLPVRALFDHPTIETLAAQIDETRRQGQGEPLPPITRAPRTVTEPHPTAEKAAAVFPLSYAQQRMWLLCQLEGGSAAYHIPSAFAVRGPFDLSALAETMQTVCHRHESLRTIFPDQDGTPRQVILEAAGITPVLLDLSGLDEASRQKTAQQIAEAEVRLPFDLNQGPLTRLKVLRLNHDTHHVLLTMHHIISDGWSAGVLVAEVLSLYQSNVLDQTNRLPEPQLQYADYALWQHEWLQGERLQRQRDFWTATLEDAPPVITMPTDRPRAALQHFIGATHRFHLDQALHQSWRRMCKRFGVTLFMGLEATFAMLLSRFARQDEVVVGTPIANRNHGGLEPLIGFFANTLALRNDLKGDPSFEALLARTRKLTLDAFDHQDLPFEQVVEILHPDRNLSHTPLFQVMFVLQNAPVRPDGLLGLAVEPLQVVMSAAKFDLTFTATETAAGLSCELEYDTNLFDAATIAALVNRFTTLLQAIPTQPDRRISRLPLLSEAEVAQLVAFNDTHQAYPHEVTVVDLFEAQAKRRPEATAFCWDPQVDGFNPKHWTFAAFDQAADLLAYRLRTAGVGPESVVAFRMERSFEMGLSVLAIHKAGGAYLALAPDLPESRLAFMLADAGAQVVLTAGAFAGNPLPDAVKEIALCQTELAVAPTLDRTACEAGPKAGPGNLAYVIYTSGSTGQPKGVAVPHGGLCNTITANAAKLDLASDHWALHFNAMQFDAGATSYYSTYSRGACLSFASDEQRHDYEALMTVIRRQRIYTTDIPTSVLATLPVGDYPDLKALVTGGDACTAALADAWARDRKLFNDYGPTETTISAIIWECQPNGERPPIGYPFPNTEAYILDANMLPVPMGWPGELFLGGVGVTRNYLNRPDLTAEKFVPNPFHSGDTQERVPGEGTRLYATGDLVRFRGVTGKPPIDFLGRIDHQVKLRGFRIELGEIEAAMSAFPGVNSVVVRVLPDQKGEKRLVAHLRLPDTGLPVNDKGMLTGNEADSLKQAIREDLLQRLPAYMCPSLIIPMAAFPMTLNGKVDQRKLPIPTAGETGSVERLAPQGDLERDIAAIWCDLLQLEQVGLRDNFFEVGGHSMLVAQLRTRLQNLTGREIPLPALFQHATIEALAAYLGGGPATEAAPKKERPTRRRRLDGESIAVIGMAANFPDAPDIASYWRNLRDGVEAVKFFSDLELQAAGVDPAMLKNPNYVKAGIVLADMDRFDAAFFGYTPREAETMDPQQRLFLESAWTALEHAGYDPAVYPGAIGVYAGSGLNTYLLHNLLPNPELQESVGGYEGSIRNEKDFLATRVAYKLNLRGPAVAVQTACSTSLVAVHMACGGLLGGECDMALAGGVSLNLRPETGYLYREGMIFSPDGHCRAFDEQAAGTIGGSGCGVVVLKRLSDALAEGDNILAVIKGSAINNDGSAKVGYTAPGVSGQTAAIRDALSLAELEPSQISYIEAHGTGTKMGDPIEFAALREVFTGDPRGVNACAVGSVKSNMGHTDSAAGVAGLIKTVLALHHEMLPPSLHCETPNPALELAKSPFYINTGLKPWPRGEAPRAAGVSSFGIGGTNAHAVLVESPQVEPGTASRGPQLLIYSARSESARQTMGSQLADHLEAEPNQNLADAAYTLQTGRARFDYRAWLVCETAAEGAALIRAGAMGLNRVDAGRKPKPVFLFPGQGSQYAGMAAGLYQTEPVFREYLDQCAAHLKPLLKRDPLALLFNREAQEELRRTEYAQPLIFAVSYALAMLWRHRGVAPAAMLGHSIGEYAAACLSGVFSLEDALALVTARGALMQDLPAGAMLAIPLSQKELQPYLSDAVSIAAVNGPDRCVVSGPSRDIAKLRYMMEADFPCRELVTSHAFHSAMMDPILETFETRVRLVKRHAPTIPFVSNLTGEWITAEQACDPAYWRAHLRGTVLFEQGLRRLFEDPAHVLLEVGPGHTLATLARRHPERGDRRVILTSMQTAKEKGDDQRTLLQAQGGLWAAGVPMDWTVLHQGGKRRRAALPTYPFERERYWIEAPKQNRMASTQRTRRDQTNAGPPAPIWRDEPLGAGAERAKPFRGLVFIEDAEAQVLDPARIAQEDGLALMVRPGEAFSDGGSDGFVLRPGAAEDIRAMFALLADRGFQIDQVVYAWGLLPMVRESGWGEEKRVADLLTELSGCRALQGLPPLVEVLDELEPTRPRLTVISRGLAEVTGEEVLTLEGAAMAALGEALTHHSRPLSCRVVDVVPKEAAKWRRQRLAGQLAAEILAGNDPVVAYRGKLRWVLNWGSPEIDESYCTRGFQQNGAYLVVGADWGEVLDWGELLADELNARLMLATPGVSLETEQSNDLQKRLVHLRETGVRVEVVGHITQPAELREAMSQSERSLGALNGLIFIAGSDGDSVFKGGLEAAEPTRPLPAHWIDLGVIEIALEGMELDFCVVVTPPEKSNSLGTDAARHLTRIFAERHNRTSDTPLFGLTLAPDAAWSTVDLGRLPAPGEAALLRVLTPAKTRAERKPKSILDEVRIRPRLSGHQRPNLPTPYVAPDDPMEEALAAIWSEAFGIEQVGVNDDFFLLGGDSLLAVRVLGRCSEVLGIEIPVRDLFASPTIAGLCDRAVAAFESSVRQSPLPPIEHRERDGEIPLSFSQQRLWFLYRMDPINTSYNMPFGLRLKGTTHIAALEWSLGEIVKRHDELRTTFAEHKGGSFLKVASFEGFQITLVDLVGIPEREALNLILAEQETRHPFDLERGPLLRTYLLRNSAEDHILLFDMHHIISDGWSIGVMINELAVLYEHYTMEREGLPPLPALSVQYVDYTFWQRERLEVEVFDRQIAYWREQLAHAPNLLELPTDRPRPPIQTFRGRLHWFSLEAAKLEPARKLAEAHGTTLFMTLQAVYAVLMSRYSRQDDILLGFPVANRTREELEPLIGFFVNMVVLRNNLSGAPNFTQLLDQVRHTALDAFAHQEVPFERVVDALHLNRDMGYSPLFQVAFILQNTPMEDLRLAGLRVDPFDFNLSTSKFDLTLSVTEENGGIRGDFEYNADLFDEATIARMSRHFKVLLEAACRDPHDPVARLPLLDEDERDLLLYAWNDRPSAFPRDKGINQLFAQQAAQTPDAVALLHDNRQLTYAALDLQANRLAHYLQDLGVGPESLVGVYAESSFELIVGLLAINKAGGAYLPLDPTYPTDRIAYMLEDGQVEVLLTQERLLARIPNFEGTTIYLDSADFSAYADNEPHWPARPDNLIYVIYTSGSTGRPKGVQIEHWTVAALCFGVDYVDYTNATRVVLQMAPISFDASTFELWGALLHGRTCALYPERVADVALLGGALHRYMVDTLWLTTPLFNFIIDEAPETLKYVRQVLVGGESLSVPHVRRAQQALPNLQVINAYGPTENTCFTTCYPVPRDLPADSTAITLGGPIHNCQLYILDDYLNPVPIGVPGELYIGGSGLQRGYRNRPRLNAEVLVPNPFSGEPGARMYRVYDLCRFRPNGDIDILGRTDHQVKIRGYRIELGEIEATLLAHVHVREAVVMAREDVPGHKQLVGYVRQTAGSSGRDPRKRPLTEAELRDYLKGVLPEYMVPTSVMVLDAFPVTPNGKVDRGALPAPLQSDGGEDYQPPANQSEEILALIWAEILGKQQVSVTGNFFDMGGHSLLATQIVSRVEEAFGVTLPLRTLFESPTVSALVGRIEQLRLDEPEHAPPAIERSSATDDPPLSFSQQRLWFLFQLDPQNTAYNMPFAFKLNGALDTRALGAAINRIVERHEPLRTTFRVRNSQPVQIVAPMHALTLPVVDLSGLNEAAREIAWKRAATAQADHVFHLTDGPLIVVNLLHLAADRHVLLLNLHHIISDGWSMGVLVRELGAFYAPVGSSRPLPDPPIRYADFSRWQQNHLQGEVLERQLAYWRGQLQGAPSLHDMLTDRPRPAIQTFRGEGFIFKLDAQLTEALNQLSRRSAATLFMTLQAAFAVLVSRYARQEDVVIGTPVANRNHKEVEPLIGFFINNLVLRNNLRPADEGSQAPGFREIIDRSRRTALEAYAHQDVPFEKIVDAVQPERNMSYSPLFQIMLILQNAPMGPLELPGLTLEMVDTEAATAKFDFLLSFMELDGGLEGSMEYNADLFHQATMRRFCNHLEVLLRAVVADPECAIDRLPLIDEAERAMMLDVWNYRPGVFPRDRCINQLFEAQVQRTPDAVALLYENRQLSYTALDRRANQLAHHLQSLGVGAETLVGVYAESSIPLIEALIAINKAGGAYLPLDPTYPMDRVAYMIAEGDVQVLLTQSHLRDRLTDFKGTVICLDEADFSANPTTWPICPARSDNLAYVIYTSGSTGRPKGVQIEHWTVAALCFGVDYVDYTNTTRVVLQMAPISFDASTFELWGVLLHGRTCALYPERVANIELLGGALKRYRVDTLWLTTPLFNFVIDEAPDTLRYVRQVLVGGESLSVTHVRRAQRALPLLQVINAYGPTENTCFTTCYHIPRDLPSDAVSISLGGPIANCQLYVVDAQLNPQPIGVPGELYIGGSGLQRGYRNRPRLNAEVLIPNPFSGQPGSRLYKVNDLCRRLPDGTIDILGRTDHQVKIRGFRIELGEIESALIKHDQVREAVVMAREDVPGKKQLVGYVRLHASTKEADAVDGGAMRSFLKQSLPEYMAPTAFVFLETFPYTPNGKVDRRALPAPDLQVSQSHVPPRDETEAELARIWADLLQVEQVGIEDNFFDLGGHSLLAARVSAWIRESFGVVLPLRSLFEAPTVAALAQRVKTAGGGQSENAEIPIVADGTTIPATLSQQRLWARERREGASGAYSMPNALVFRGVLDVAALEAAIQTITDRHDSIRASFVETAEHGLLLKFDDDMCFNAPCIDLRGLAADAADSLVKALVRANVEQPFDLEQGPLLRGALLRLNERGHVLLMNMHHIISDGWSVGVFSQELALSYQALVTGRPSPLQPLPIRFRDYAVWMRGWLTPERAEAQLQYWLQRLEGAPPLLNMPLDRPRPAVQTYEGAGYEMSLSADLIRRLNELARESGGTLFMVLQTAYAVVLSQYGGQDDIIVATPVANRVRKEIEPLIGLFLNAVVLRNDLSGDPSFKALCRRNAPMILDAFANQDIPLAHVIAALKPKLDPSYTPVFQTMIALQNMPLPDEQLPGLNLSALPSGDATVKYDLAFTAQMEGGELVFSFEYKTGLFDHQTIVTFCDHMKRLLESAVERPDAPLSKLPRPQSRERLGVP